MIGNTYVKQDVQTDEIFGLRLSELHKMFNCDSMSADGANLMNCLLDQAFEEPVLLIQRFLGESTRLSGSLGNPSTAAPETPLIIRDRLGDVLIHISRVFFPGVPLSMKTKSSVSVLAYLWRFVEDVDLDPFSRRVFSLYTRGFVCAAFEVEAEHSTQSLPARRMVL